MTRASDFLGENMNNKQPQVLVLIDSQVTDYEALLTGICPATPVFILNHNEDGVKQITEILQAYSQPQQLYLFAHGKPGLLQLGNTQLSLDTLKLYRQDVATWSVENLIIYGCQVAMGDAGAEFIEKLHQITGAEIAASTKLVGNANLGGNWELDYTTNNVNVTSILPARAIANYQHTLIINAGDDTLFINSAPWGGQGFVNVISNDNSDSPINAKSVDLDLSKPGVQNWFSNGLFTVTSWGVNYRGVAFNCVSVWVDKYPPISGTFNVPYTVKNKAGETSNVANLKINIKPYAADDFGATTVNSSEIIFVTENDRGLIDPASLDLDPTTPTKEKTFTVAGKGTFTADNLGWVTFTPAQGFTGPVSIPYRVDDIYQQFSNQSKINVNVGAGNLAPFIFSPVRQQMISSGLSLGNPFQFGDKTYVDPDGDPITYSATTVTASGSWLSYINTPNGGTYVPKPGATLNESPLPDWLKFYPDTETFAAVRDRQNPYFTSDVKWIKVTGRDPFGASVTEVIPLYRKGSGVAVDDYIVGSQVFFDANKNNQIDDNEPSTITNQNGEYDFGVDMLQFDTNQNGELDPSEGKIVVIGGVDSATGLVLDTPLTATPDSGVVTLLTTIVSELVDKDETVQAANQKVVASLGLPTDLPVNQVDPVAASLDSEPGSSDLLSVMAQTQNLVTQAAGLLEGASSLEIGDASASVISAIADKTQTGTPMDLTNPADIKPLVESAAAKVKEQDPTLNLQEVTIAASALAQVVAESNKQIDSAIDANASNPNAAREQVAAVQKVALGETTDDFKAVGAGEKTPEAAIAENTGAALLEQIVAAATTINIPDVEPPPTPTPTPTPTPSPNPSTTPIVSPPLPSTSSTPTPTPSRSSPSLPVITISGTVSTANISTNLSSGLPQNTALGDDLYLLSDSADTSIPVAAVGKTILALSGDDSLEGTGANETFFGNQGNDVLNGGSGNDQLLGGKGSDSLNGGSGNDFASGNNDNDTVLGGDGDDALYGGKQDDSLLGGAGADFLSGDLGFDILTGGSDNDVFAFSVNTDDPGNVQKADVVTDFQTGDLIDLPDNISYSSLTFEVFSLQLGTAPAVTATALKTGNNYLGIVVGATPENNSIAGTITLRPQLFI